MKTDRFSEIGLAALIPGAQWLLDQMQEQLNVLRQTLQAHQETREESLRQVARNVNAEFGIAPKRRGPGRPPGRGQNPWAGMSAEERSVEMRRRQKVAAKRRAAGLKPINTRKGVKSWSDMTAAERSIEMFRRRKVAAERRAAGLKPGVRDAIEAGAGRGKAGASHPRDARHPGHAAWLRKISKANKKTWASLSEADRKARIGGMVKGAKAAHQAVRDVETLVNGAA